MIILTSNTVQCMSPLLQCLSINDSNYDEYVSQFKAAEILAVKDLPKHKLLEKIAGKVAAKQAILECVQAHFGITIPYCIIEIISRKFNRPTFRILPSSNINKVSRQTIERSLNFSISHSGEHAVASAAVTSNEGYIGVDLERIRT